MGASSFSFEEVSWFVYSLRIRIPGIFTIKHLCAAFNLFLELDYSAHSVFDILFCVQGF